MGIMVMLRDKSLTTRWAVYWAPRPTDPLWRAGSSWLGRDAREAAALSHSAGPWGLTQDARRYGLHATLKAPLRLRPAEDPVDFLHAVQDVARQHRAFMLPAMHVAGLGRFLALRPVQEPQADHPLPRLAHACVKELDAWRAPPDEAERMRRAAAVSADTQLHELMLHWGYPYVLSRWRFHLTLTDALPPEDTALRQRLQAQAEAHFEAALREPWVCDSICVFVEPAPGQPFELRHRFSLGE